LGVAFFVGAAGLGVRFGVGLALATSASPICGVVDSTFESTFVSPIVAEIVGIVSVLSVAGEVIASVG